MTGNEPREPEVVTLYALFEHHQVHEMHRTWVSLILKGEDKEGGHVHEKSSSIEMVNHAVKKALTVWGNTSSDSDVSEYSDDAFMEELDDEDANEEVTLSYFKQNSNNFSISKLRKLVVVLNDLISELTTENDLVDNCLDISQDEKIALVTQIYDIEKERVVLEAENTELKEKIKRVTTTVSKGKNEASSLQLEFENKLQTAERKMKLALERNLVLERDLVRVKEELNKSIKWTTSSKILTNLISQGNNSRRGLGCEKKYSPYNPQNKTVSDVDDFLCVHCG